MTVLLIVAAALAITAVVVLAWSVAVDLWLAEDLLLAAVDEDPHEDWCPLAPAFVPDWAVTGLDQGRVRVHHPPVPCAGCSADVWWSVRDQLSNRGRLYCSPECRHLAGNPPSTRVLPACPRPDKEAFSTREDAGARFAALLLTDLTFRVYPCHCGSWHGGRRDRRVDEGQRVRNIARIVTTGGDGV